MKTKPAFPQSCQDNGRAAYVDGGMDLRDYFAAKVLQGIASRVTTMWTEDDIAHDAEKAYKYADAVMKQREKI